MHVTWFSAAIRSTLDPRRQYPLLEPAYFDIARERIPERGRACSSSNHARLRFLLITIEHRIFVPSPREFPSSSPLGERRGGAEPCCYEHVVFPRVSTSLRGDALSVETREEERGILGGTIVISQFRLLSLSLECFSSLRA